MAEVGKTPIQLYRTTTAGAAPAAGNLSPGELAININDADMALYAENASGVVKRVINNPAGLKYPTADGTSGQVVTTDGAGNLTFTTAASGDVTLNGTQTLTNKTLTAPVLTGNIDATGSIRSGITAVAASAIDCTSGNFFTKTATGALSWTISNAPASRAYSFLLELTNGGTGTQTWFTGTKWPGGTAPTLTASGVDLLGFITDDGGTTWRGVQLMKDSK